jgi:hypothetical protein
VSGSRDHRLGIDLRGPIAQGTTRHCRLSLFGGINERIDVHGPNRRLTIHILEAFKLLLSDAVADFNITPNGRGTESTLHYRYTLNRLGRMAKGATTGSCARGSPVSATACSERANESLTVREPIGRPFIPQIVMTTFPWTRPVPK